jgi:hypothetical protein
MTNRITVPMQLPDDKRHSSNYLRSPLFKPRVLKHPPYATAELNLRHTAPHIGTNCAGIPPGTVL